jgi:hypothetical protein
MKSRISELSSTNPRKSHPKGICRFNGRCRKKGDVLMSPIVKISAVLMADIGVYNRRKPQNPTPKLPPAAPGTEPR